MTSPIRPCAVLLDLDGTLADSLPVMRLAYRRFLEQFGLEPTDAEFESLNGPPLAEVVHRLKTAHALQGADELLLADYLELIDRGYAQVAPCPGASELLELARAHRCTIGIVTSNSLRRTQTWLETAGLALMIDFIVSGEEVRQGKPHPEPYLLASRRAACPCAGIIAVEDSALGARSAVDAGLKTFILTDRDAKSRAWPEGVVPVGSLARLARQLW